MAVVLHVLHHQVVVRQVSLVPGVARGAAARQRADCVVLGAARRQRIISGVGLHVQLVVLVVFVDEGLLLALLLELLVGLLLVMGGSQANCGGAGVVVVVAQVDLHARLLLALGLVDVGGPSEDVDLLVKAGVVVEVLVEASVPALAALVGLLGVVTRLVQVVLVDEAGARVDDLAARASRRIHGSGSVASRDRLLIPRLPCVQVIHLQLRLPLRALVVRTVAEVGLLQADCPLICLHLRLAMRLIGLLLELLRSCLILQIVGAALDILMLLVPVDVLVRAAQCDRLPHVGIVVDLAALVVAARAYASGEQIVWLLGELRRVLLLVMVLRLLRLVNAVKGIGIEVAVVLLRHGLA